MTTTQTTGSGHVRFELRPYQLEALDLIDQAEARGVRRQLGVASTGLGKTVMFCALAERRGCRTLILAHRDELISQAATKVAEVWPGADVGVVKAERDEVRSHVVVASVQTLARPSRMSRLCSPFDGSSLLGVDSFGLVIVDECFPAGTLIGGRPIEQIRPGDLVPSWDEQSGQWCLAEVLQTMQRRTSQLVRVTFEDGEQVTCTPNHPIRAAEGWVQAGGLIRDALVLSWSHHAAATHRGQPQGPVPHWRRVARVEVLEPGCSGGPEWDSGGCDVFNLEVDGTHTYLVGAGIVVHNCHHASAETYRAVLDRLNCGAPAGPLLLGVTATPDRADGKGLGDLFDEIVFNFDLLWGIRSGYLSDLRGLAVTLDNFDESQLTKTRGDYDQGQAGRLLDEAGAPSLIVQAWLQHAKGRRTLVFTPTVALAGRVADTFTAAGVRAGMVHGGTPIDERRSILAAYSHGDLDVVCNCAVLTEGYDEPRTDCIVVARPTQSRALFTQMIGRGSRRHPDKTDCLVLDIVGASAQHSLVTVPSLFGVGPKFAKRCSDGSSPVSEVVAEHVAFEVAQGRLRAEEADLFASVRAEGIAWVPFTDPDPAGVVTRRYIRTLPKRDGRAQPTVVLAERADGWVAGLWHPDGHKEALAVRTSLETAQAVGEDFVRRHAPRALTTADAPWRQGRPSRKALAFARRLKLAVDKSWNAGQLSDAIDAKLHKTKRTETTEVTEHKEGAA